ncbi:DUF1996 domain-containing protein [Dactylosporangium aurantiacum]|uniref:DUF1996 domain-containing protein n=1 Tax=Dactylosporangium aurantiacum TaxID=35754 RepID=UPI000526116F|nr:DUF1996 domain-containing protein [Dactylosporangium aurantiacum]MDG6101624.1 DUF1996 domain-containing protein [Dactylosporangium aurantiacum]
MSARVLGRGLVRKSLIGLALTALVGTYAATRAFSADAAEIPISQGKPVTASSVENGGAAAANAVDGNGGTRWSSAFSDPQWLRVDLGAPATITKVVLNWEAAYARDFTIQTSADGASWTTINTTVNSTGGVQTLDVSGSGRYVKLNTTRRATQYGVSLWEFQVFGTGGSTPTSNPTTIPPGAVRVAEFLADCPFSHRLPDDPIVFPGLPGASHMHSFFGSTVTNGNTTVNDLANGPSNCNPAVDKSSYWVPTLYQDGVAKEPVITTFYYLGEGVSDAVREQTQSLPYGLRIVAGNAKATAPDATTISRWSCLHHNEAGAGKDFINCPADSMLESYLDFPQCWNGRDLDSADHKSHMAYPVNGACPATHPVPVPKLRQVLRYPVNGDPSRIRLSSGAGFTMHGDFFNAWPQAEMDRRVAYCIRLKVKCGADGRA